VNNDFLLVCIVFIVIALMAAFVSENPTAKLKDCEEELMVTRVQVEARGRMLERHHEEYRNLYKLWIECRETLSACVDFIPVEVPR